MKSSTSITSDVPAEKGLPVNNQPASRPIVGITIGDPCGIGPEVIAKAWADEKLHQTCNPVLIGSVGVMGDAVRIAGLHAQVRAVPRASQVTHSHTIDVIEPVEFDMAWVRYGQDVERAGWASGAWLDHADRLARQGALAASVMGPISSGSMKMAGTLGSIATNRDSGAYLLLHSGPLTIAHLSDHVPLASVSSLITTEAVLTLLRSLDDWMKQAGLKSRRIAVAGFNPHAEGREEREQIDPAIAIARSEGLDVAGPISPDSVFRHCIEGRYDVVVAMYHDQGHIAMKTWGFSGNSVAMIGPPYIHMTVAHGVAHEIAGLGKADHTMILNAILNAATLASGQGFYD